MSCIFVDMHEIMTPLPWLIYKTMKPLLLCIYRTTPPLLPPIYETITPLPWLVNLWHLCLDGSMERWTLFPHRHILKTLTINSNLLLSNRNERTFQYINGLLQSKSMSIRRCFIKTWFAFFNENIRRKNNPSERKKSSPGWNLDRKWWPWWRTRTRGTSRFSRWRDL